MSNNMLLTIPLFIGTTEIVLIAALILLLFGGKKFPEIAEICGMKSRQHAYEVYRRANSHKY